MLMWVFLSSGEKKVIYNNFICLFNFSDGPGLSIGTDTVILCRLKCIPNFNFGKLLVDIAYGTISPQQSRGSIPAFAGTVVFK
jgi:hypothetical protein